MATPDPPVITIVGPTATGKSDLAVGLANRIGAEIINADAMQLYRGMDIGTAKLPESQQGGTVHHLLDVLDVRESASVQQYQRWARAAIEKITAAGRRAILVGGSGLYVRAAVDKLEFPPRDMAVRDEITARAEAHGPAPLYADLQRADPKASEKIAPTNTRRIIRALEVIELTGRPFSATMPDYTYEVPATQLGLHLDRPVIDERVENRVYRMFRDGLVDEVRGLTDRGLRDGATARSALGYAQVLDHLAGETTEAEAIDSTITGTRRFARRQEKWFRRDPRINWLDASAGLDELLDVALKLVG